MDTSKAWTIPSTLVTTFDMDYAVDAPDLRRLYENAKRDQWNASKDIAWDAPPSPDGRVIADELDDISYPMPKNEVALFESILGESRWYLKTIALQLVAETFAVALFKMMAESARDPVLGEVCRRILLDESRHMGFGMLSLPDVVNNATSKEREELEDYTCFALETTLTG